MLAACQIEHQNKVNTSGFMLTEQENEEEIVGIVKLEGDKGLELVSSSKTMKVALDNSPFYDEGIMKVTPNHDKNLFVVSVSKTANLHKLRNEKEWGEFQEVLEMSLPYERVVRHVDEERKPTRSVKSRFGGYPTSKSTLNRSCSDQLYPA